MPSQRFQQISRIKVTDVLQEVAFRNHSLVHYTVGKKDNSIIPKSSRVMFRCNNCGHEWETRLGVYLNSKTKPSAGCRGCYNRNVVNPEMYPKSPCIQQPTVKNRPKRREGLKRLREAHLAGQFGFIQNRKTLLLYLEENPNAHNTFVLELLRRDSHISEGNDVLLGQTLKHHVLPIFEQGSPDSWNMIKVTPEEHMQIHKLRFEVYGKEGDKKAIYATTSDFNRWSIESDNENNTDLSFEKERVVVHWGVLRRTPEVSLAIETGMVWTHKDGFVCQIEPNSVETVKEILDKLIGTLPENHSDRIRLQGSSSVSNYIRRHIETIFPVPGVVQRSKRQNGAYNFTVVPFAGSFF